MVIEARENVVSAWAFLSGVVLAIVLGLTTIFIPIASLKYYSSAIYAILVVLGLIVGFSIKVSTKDFEKFMVAGGILVIVSKFGMDGVRGSLIGIGIGDVVASTFGALIALFAPATILVALKMVFEIAKI